MSYLEFDRIDRKKKSKKIIVRIVVWLLILTAIIIFSYITVNYSIEKTIMSGFSMGETLQDGDEIIINKLSYIISEPKRFDIIVFKQDGKEHNYYNIKRIIGLPGEIIQIIDGSVYINGEKLEEPINVDEINIPGLAIDELLLLEDEYFVLGDERNDSEDSRFANIGNVVKSDIIGKAYIRIKPTISIISQNNLKKETVNNNDNDSADDTDITGSIEGTKGEEGSNSN